MVGTHGEMMTNWNCNLWSISKCTNATNEMTLKIMEFALMKKTDKEELDNLFQEIISKFNSRCWICRGKYNTKESFVIHHRKYKESDRLYSDFKLPNGKPDRLNYHRYLIPLIKKEGSKRFLLLHHKHHWMAENWARLKKDNFERMVKVSREIIKQKNQNTHFH